VGIGKPLGLAAVRETNTRARSRSVSEQEARFAAERRRERRGHPLDVSPITLRDIDQRIAAALGEERRAVIPIVAECINELVDAEREHHKSELLERTRGLELAVARLESTLAQLQLALATERKSIIDLPNPLRH
jgi:hypothetical protein